MLAMLTVIYPPRATMLSSRSSSGLRLAVDLSLGILVQGSGKKLLLDRGGLGFLNLLCNFSDHFSVLIHSELA